MTNKYGLDYKYFQRKLKLIIRDAKNYTPDEMARELARMSQAADKSVIQSEDEFYWQHPESIPDQPISEEL
tara:strand:+ start:2314 stop:2526 length:213 start_codon:yes stop_codon:yes gene_type:complete